MKKKTLLTLEKLQNLQELDHKPLEKWLKEKKSNLIKLHRDIESLIEKLFLKCQENLMKIKSEPELISYILEYPLKSNWTIFIDKLNTSDDQNMLVIILFKTLVQESISKENEFKPFWKTVYKELSEKLWLPTKTDFPDLDTILSKASSLKQVEKLPCLTKKTIVFPENKNFLKTYYLSSTSSIVDKWVKENTKNPVKFKTLNVKLNLTSDQKMKFKQYEGCFRSVHNNALYKIRFEGENPNFYDLRNLLVTKKTKLNSSLSIHSKKYLNSQYEKIKELKQKILIVKENKCLEKELETLEAVVKQEKADFEELIKEIPYTKNFNIPEWQKEFHKDLRASAVKKACDSYTTCLSNLKKNNIDHFDIRFMKKSAKKKSFELSSSQMYLKDGVIRIPGFGAGISSLKTSKRNKERLKKMDNIKNNCDIIFYKREYWIKIPIEVSYTKEKETSNVCGIDPGICKIASVYSENGFTEYKHNRLLLYKLNQKLQLLKTKRKRKNRNGVRKKQINKIEKRKIDYTNQLHWEFIKDLLDNNDVVFFGDIKSQDIVSKETSFSDLNQEFNDVKFFTLKQRLIYKAKLRSKIVILTNEAFTSKTCSNCGTLKNIKKERHYHCEICNSEMDRDNNAAKNILMRGILA